MREVRSEEKERRISKIPSAVLAYVFSPAHKAKRTCSPNTYKDNIKKIPQMAAM